MKEAFAQYFSFLATWDLHESKKDFTEYGVPDKSLYFFQMMELEKEMLKEHRQKSLYQDGRPMIETMNYVYERGAIFVRMLSNIFGEGMFQNKVRSFIKKYEFKNVDHEQLWEELESSNPFKATNVSLSKIFNSWIMQDGVPIVSVNSCQTNDTCQNKLFLKQQKYSSSLRNNNESLPSIWFIPITFSIVYNENGQFKWFPSTSKPTKFLMPQTTETVVYEHSFLPSLGSKSALILNMNHTGMYHVTYDEQSWKNIGKILKENVDIFPVGTRRMLFWSLKLSLKRKEIKVSLFLCIGEYAQVSVCSKSFYEFKSTINNTSKLKKLNQ